MPWLNPSVADFKAQFFRDFPYGTDVETDILDQDIMNAFQEVNININPNLFMSQGSYTLGYLYFAAFNVSTNLQNSSQGIQGQYNGPQQSKGVSGVSESVVVPEKIAQNPLWATMWKNPYGNKYLMMILPRMAGPMLSVRGHTKP